MSRKMKPMPTGLSSLIVSFLLAVGTMFVLAMV